MPHNKKEKNKKQKNKKEVQKCYKMVSELFLDFYSDTISSSFVISRFLVHLLFLFSLALCSAEEGVIIWAFKVGPRGDRHVAETLRCFEAPSRG